MKRGIASHYVSFTLKYNLICLLWNSSRLLKVCPHLPAFYEYHWKHNVNLRVVLYGNDTCCAIVKEKETWIEAVSE